MSLKRKNLESISPPGTPGLRAAKRRKPDRDASVVPVHLKGMKAANPVHDETGGGADDDADEEDFMAMEEDDYTLQQKWQSQSKANLKWVSSSNIRNGRALIVLQSFNGELYARST